MHFNRVPRSRDTCPCFMSRNLLVRGCTARDTILSNPFCWMICSTSADDIPSLNKELWRRMFCSKSERLNCSMACEMLALRTSEKNLDCR